MSAPPSRLNGDCHCVIHEPPDDRGSRDDRDRKLVADVERHGWAIIGIEADEGLPGWAFSVGLWHTFGSPEIAMFGLRARDMQGWLNDVGEQIRAGQLLLPDEPRTGILPNFPVVLRAADDSWYREFFGYALWFTQQPPLPVVQVVWPDRLGRFPWDPGCGERSTFDQPQLWLPKDQHPMGRWTRIAEADPWPFSDPPATRVLTTRRIAFDGGPVVYVVHEDDGAWEFLDGEDVTADDLVVVHLEHVIGAHPGLGEVADLPRGWEAWQESLGDEWVRQPSPPDSR